MSRDIVCCLTPAGAGAIAVIGFRGPLVWDKLSPFFTPAKKKIELSDKPQVALGQLQRYGIGDQVVLVLQGNVNEQVIELQLHGGPGIVAWCLALAQELGCELIDWTSWYSDALWNLLPLATTKKTAGILLDQCQGAFRRAIEQLHEPNLDRQALTASIDELLSWASLGTHLIQPWKVVLAGPPNAGKSSLLNTLLGFERAITSPIPGTTRDLVTATLVWNGYPLEFIDTAGIRKAGDDLESAGIRLTQSVIATADLVLWLVDLNQPHYTPPSAIQHAMTVGTKAELPRLCSFNLDHLVSAKEGTGLPELLSAVLKKLVPLEPAPGQPMPVLPAQVEYLRQLRQIHTD